MSEVRTIENATGLRRFKPYPAYKDSGVEWLGEIPAHWHAKRLKYVAPVTDERSDRVTSDLPYIGLEHIESSTGQLAKTSNGVSPEGGETDSTVSIFRPGDVLFGKLRPYLAKVLRPEFEGCCSTELLVLRTAGEILPSILAYQLLSSGFIGWVNAMTYGTKMPRANPDQVVNVPVALCPVPEQNAIAAFLDRETAKIDALVAKKERLIELLQEKHSALITRAVTRGLDPNAPMRDSGIVWLGEIPAHWEVMQLGQAMHTIMDFRGRTPTKLGMQWGGDIPAISAVNVRDGYLDLSRGVNFGSRALHDRWMTDGATKKGDILFTTEAPLGNTALVPDDTQYILSQRVLLLRPSPELLECRFLHRFLSSSAFGQGVENRATGSTAEGVKRRHLVAMPVCKPPIDEQLTIAVFLERETAQIDALIAKVRDGIERLKEYRTALISAAVTGKIDLREEAA